MNAARTLSWIRRAVLLVVLLLLTYGWRRFDVVRLPEGALSPLFGIHAGDRLLIDLHARPRAQESDWLFRDAEGTLLLGRSKAVPAGHAALGAEQLWIEFEREIPGLADSRTRGPVPAADLVGRVVFVLPH